MKKIKPATITIIVILIAYTILSFYKLGNNKNPQTYVNLKDNEQLTFRIDSDQIPKKMMIYSANDESNVSIFFVNFSCFLHWPKFRFTWLDAADAFIGCPIIPRQIQNVNTISAEKKFRLNCFIFSSSYYNIFMVNISYSL